MSSQHTYTVDDLQSAARQTALPLGLATLFGLLTHLVAVFALRDERPLTAATILVVFVLLHVKPPRLLYKLARKRNGAIGRVLVAAGLVFSAATSQHPQVIAFALCAVVSTAYGEWAARRLAGRSLADLVSFVNGSSATR